jgi:ubiquinone/menaquinone biosynthesis C-methylase UbiE
MPPSVASRKTREEIAEAYRSPPWWYDARGFLILTFAYNSTLPAQLRFFGANMGPRHLEVACGTGTLLEMTLGWRRRRRLPASRIVAIDYAESMLAGAMRRFRGRDDIELKHADVAELPYPSDSFDTANIANSVHCFPEVDAGLREVQRVLKPGGVLAANVLLYPEGGGPLAAIANRINAWGIRKGILFTPFRAADVRSRLQAAGFEVIDEARRGNCLEVRARKPAAPAERAA